ncbi:uncharacterized protein TNCV_844691 [Trichonephila clavipes]|uniref:Uncharacterized protein n=1 Tax=Trichonephila clavipes TaxID=2585209 RepID=A0A8X7BKN8_TRICX|nr:uncharacterized protein TNCV_844691 [Trichonephila clavipes]
MSSRAHQTTLARFRSGHLRSMTLVQGVKSFFTCPCSLLASPAHLLDCWDISLRQFYDEQGLVWETFTRKGQMDLVSPGLAPRGLETTTTCLGNNWKILNGFRWRGESYSDRSEATIGGKQP